MPLLPIITIVHALITTVVSEIEVFLTADLTAALVTQDLEAEDSLAAADLDQAI